jgi:PAS domain S-box-containing protein
MTLRSLNNFPGDFFDCIGVMALLIDLRGTIRRFNRKAEDLTGYPKAEAVGRDWLSLMLPGEEHDPVWEQMASGLHPGVEHMTLSMPVMARNGSMLPVCWSLSAVRDDEGNVSGLLGLGFVPSSLDAPCLHIGREMDNYCMTVGSMTHDLINHSQVVMGYLEMAAERTGDNKELHCMLDRATKSMVKCGDIAVKVHKLSNGRLK